MNNTYGLECRTTCGHCRDRRQCQHVSGSCPNGCDRGVHGVKCDTGLDFNVYDVKQNLLLNHKILGRR